MEEQLKLPLAARALFSLFTLGPALVIIPMTAVFLPLAVVLPCIATVWLAYRLVTKSVVISPRYWTYRSVLTEESVLKATITGVEWGPLGYVVTYAGGTVATSGIYFFAAPGHPDGFGGRGWEAETGEHLAPVLDGEAVSIRRFRRPTVAEVLLFTAAIGLAVLASVTN